MLELKGRYNSAKVFTHNIENEAISQIVELLNQDAFKESKVRVMPDTHAGKGCVIGFTANLRNKAIPNLVGVDIGCGMIAVKLGDVQIDFERLDKFIRNNIPHGNKVNKKVQTRISKEFHDRIVEISNKTKSNPKRNLLSIGSLGGGNHFIEINQDKNSDKWLVIHSGSRNFGHKIATYHQKRAIEYCSRQVKYFNVEKNERIELLKQAGKEEEIQGVIEQFNPLIEKYNLPKYLCFLEDTRLQEYLNDMKTAQEYANLNRRVMSIKILEFLSLNIDELENFQTIHNYIDFDDMIVRKGAISAGKDEKLLIPINMRDGSIIALGKGNEDWNNSAPHGAGRLMSRSKAKEVINLDEYKETMKMVWSTSVKESTLDEAPMAYKPMDEIIENIKDTVEIVDIIRPLYNFKA
ncbi:RtcB family protein [Wukongibacter baidiensis]|uniref:RtcB family protein n=1 Tax=Wukongibacter baidiensis TaxID=1723361 RepID=UPI003D7F5AC0